MKTDVILILVVISVIGSVIAWALVKGTPVETAEQDAQAVDGAVKAEVAKVETVGKTVKSDVSKL